MGELVRPSSSPFVAWVRAWCCQKCGHVWPIRNNRLPAVDPTGQGPTQVPKKCPLCGDNNWTEAYKYRSRRAEALRAAAEAAAAEQAEDNWIPSRTLAAQEERARAAGNSTPAAGPDAGHEAVEGRK